MGSEQTPSTAWVADLDDARRKRQHLQPRLLHRGQVRAAQIQGVIYAVLITSTLYVIVTGIGIPFSVPYQVLAMLTAAFSYLLFRRFDLTEPWHLGRAGSIGTRLLYTWFGMIGALLFVAYAAKYSAYFSRMALLLWVMAAPCVLLCVHWAARRLLGSVVPGVTAVRSAVIVFANESGRALARNLARSPRYRMLGYFDDRDTDRVGDMPQHPRLGHVADVADYVRAHGAEVVFVMLPDEGVKRAAAVLDALGDTTASVYFVPDFYIFELLGAEVSEIAGVPVMRIADTPFYGADGLFKQVFDYLLAAMLLVFVVPLGALIALAIKLDSPGPVFYGQQRCGFNGRPFQAYKFRSMTHGDHARQVAPVAREDSRVTRVGRFLRRTSLDELPQLWNVMRGEMSLVGPRPHALAYNDLYRKEIKRYMMRHKVKPGITGWAQVHGLRGDTPQFERIQERIRYDLEYIRNWSPWLDLRILLMTALMVLRDRNAY